MTMGSALQPAGSCKCAAQVPRSFAARLPPSSEPPNPLLCWHGARRLMTLRAPGTLTSTRLSFCCLAGADKFHEWASRAHMLHTRSFA